jgi:type I restriction enzyme R subunit
MNADMMKKNPKYIMRITSEDYENKKQLDNFIDPDSPYPTIVTTSELLSTGVDCKTCGLIVIDKEIQSMTMFKQIIGRGTRLYEDKNKLFFDIMDFRGATELFNDPEFDGESCDVPVGVAGGGTVVTGGGDAGPQGPTGGGKGGEKHKKHVFKGRNIMINGETVSVLGIDGKELQVTNVYDFTRGNILQKYASLNDFLISWNATDRHQAIMDELAEYSVFIDAVREANPALKDSDVFDIICHVAYGQKPLTRKERANNVKKRNYFAKYEGKAREVLEALLDKYSDQGVLNLEDPNILTLNPFASIGTPVKIIKLFGGMDGYKQAINELEKQLYAS